MHRDLINVAYFVFPTIKASKTYRACVIYSFRKLTTEYFIRNREITERESESMRCPLFRTALSWGEFPHLKLQPSNGYICIVARCKTLRTNSSSTLIRNPSVAPRCLCERVSQKKFKKCLITCTWIFETCSGRRYD